MYLNSLAQKMPSGHFTRRLAEKNFKRESSDRYKQVYYWLSYVMHKEGIHIQHQFNGGEYCIPPYKVDGFDSSTLCVYEYLGCRGFN